MKTGRVRSKESAPVEATPAPAPGAESDLAAAPPSEPAAPAPPGPRGPRNPILWVFIGIVAVISCIALAMALRECRGADEWVQASQASGTWSTQLQAFAPQVQVVEMWETSCRQAQGAVQTCVVRDTGQFEMQPSDTYEQLAYDIYWDESHDQVYEAQGEQFVPTRLGGDERIEGSRRLVIVEALRKDTCTLTQYTVWVDDPQDASQEIEVYLHECQVWDQVTAFDAQQAPWCQCGVTSLLPLGQPLAQQGTGSQVEWPAASLPTGGKAEQAFRGEVTFSGSDGQYSLTVTTQDLAQYQDWLAGTYYLGIRDGRAVTVSKTPPK